MAYHKKSKKKAKTTRRRRRVSGIGSNTMLLTLAGAAAGYFLGPKINDPLLAKIGTNVDPKLVAAGEALLGFAIPKYLLKNSMPGKILGGLMIGAGAHLAAKEFGMVSGYRDLRSVAGYKDLKAVAGIGYNNTRMPNAAPMSALQCISGVMDK